MNTKKFFMLPGLALAGLLCLPSCQREVSGVYAFSYTNEVVVSGGLDLDVTDSFLETEGWNEVREYRSEAYSDKNARKANEEDALVDFDYKMASFRSGLNRLYREYRVAQVDSAVGQVKLELVCVSDGNRLLKRDSCPVRFVR